MSGAITCRLSKGSDQNKKNEMGRAYGKYGGQENCIRGLGGGGTHEGKRPVGRSRRRWEVNIK